MFKQEKSNKHPHRTPNLQSKPKHKYHNQIIKQQDHHEYRNNPSKQQQEQLPANNKQVTQRKQKQPAVINHNIKLQTNKPISNKHTQVYNGNTSNNSTQSSPTTEPKSIKPHHISTKTRQHKDPRKRKHQFKPNKQPNIKSSGEPQPHHTPQTNGKPSSHNKQTNN